MADESAQQRLIWIDLEMTGLDTDRDGILEIATVVTDGQLRLTPGARVKITNADHQEGDKAQQGKTKPAKGA